MKLTVSLFVLFAVFNGCYSQFPQLGSTENTITAVGTDNGQSIVDSLFSLASSILGLFQKISNVIYYLFDTDQLILQEAIANSFKDIPFIGDFISNLPTYGEIVGEFSNYTDQVTAFFNQNTENLNIALSTVPKPNLPSVSQASIETFFQYSTEIFTYLSQVITKVISQIPAFPNFLPVLITEFENFAHVFSTFPNIFSNATQEIIDQILPNLSGSFENIAKNVIGEVIPNLTSGSIFNISSLHLPTIPGIPIIG
ncbi:uncharacterized protein [Diabrotica undecimpunctata]|uniref:uncharacterized protein n=1 Tax=Diabrotica undecimpunctata TaxID=50387 RepID=UPI003B63452F